MAARKVEPLIYDDTVHCLPILIPDDARFLLPDAEILVFNNSPNEWYQ